MRSLVCDRKAISSIMLYTIISVIFIGLIFGLYYKQNIVDGLINLLPGARHTEEDPDLEANFVDEVISDLQLKSNFVQFLQKYNFEKSTGRLNYTNSDCVDLGLNRVLSSQVPVLIVDSKGDILLSVKAPKGDFDLNPRTNPVQVRYFFRSDASYVDFVWDSYLHKSFAGINKQDLYYDFSFYCSSDSSSKYGKFIQSFFGQGFYSFYVSRFIDGYFCNYLNPNFVVNFESFLSNLPKVVSNLEINYKTSFVQEDSFFDELSVLKNSYGYDSFKDFLNAKMLKGRPNYLDFWGKVNEFGYWEKPVEGMYCVNKNPYDVHPNYYCHPIYLYKEGTNEEKKYYFDYGSRIFKSVDGDVELNIASEIGVGGKIVYFAGNQMWWAGCESKELLEKGYVSHLTK